MHKFENENFLKKYFDSDAWTELDKTVYFASCAGTEGFLRLLPVYLEHILFPTLTSSGFTTEVHHITGSGEDGGAVYSEMQSRENFGEAREDLELMRNVYPGHGYSMETGGTMEMIRDSLSIEKIRNYHEKFYRAENLAVVIVGKVDMVEVANAIKPIEEKIARRKLPEYEKPWQVPVAPLGESKMLKILLPDDEEKLGNVLIGFQGPKATTEFKTVEACSMLMRYLCGTSASPLNRALIETADPYSSGITFSAREYSTSLLSFTFFNVPIDKIDSIREKFNETLLDIAEGREKFDEDRLLKVLEKYVRERDASMENCPHRSLAPRILSDFLYAAKDEDLNLRLNAATIINELKDKSLNFWLDLLRDYFIDNHSVTICCIPSIARKEELAKEEAERLEKRRQELGEEGLAQKAQELEEAKAENAKAIPLEILRLFPVPSMESISFPEFEMVRRDDESLKAFPFFIELFHLKTNFVYFTASMNTSALPDELRKFLPLFLDLLVNSPVQTEDELLSYEAVVAALDHDLLDCGPNMGLQYRSGTFSNFLTINMQVEVEKLDKAVRWLSLLLFHSVFTKDRVQVLATRLLGFMATVKKNGYEMVREISKALYYTNSSNVGQTSVLNQQNFLTELVEGLKDDESCAKIIDDLNQIRQHLIPSLALHVALNPQKVEHLNTSLIPLVEKIQQQAEPNFNRFSVTFESQLFENDGNLPEEFTGAVVGMGTVESSFLSISSPGVADFNDDDLPAVLLHIKYLSQCEGPIYKKIRSSSYGYEKSAKPNEGLINLTLYYSTNIFEAFKVVKETIEGELEASNEFDESLLESARSSLVFDVLEGVIMIGNLVEEAVANSFKCVPLNYNQLLVGKIMKVSVDDLRRVGEKYLAKMFHPGSARIAIVCHPDKVEIIKKQFEEFGHNLKPSMSLENSLLSSMDKV